MAFQTHELRFLKKNQRPVQPVTQVTAPTPNTLNGLVALDLITETPGVSISVLISGIKSAHFILEDITNWDLQANKLFVSTNNSEVWTLAFINVVEAQSGLVRLEIAMNGGTI